MHTTFGFEPAIGICAINLERHRFNTGFLTGTFFEPFKFVAMALGPAGIHAQHNGGPVLRLGTAGPRMNFQIAIIAVGFARQQRLNAGFLALAAERAYRLFGFLDDFLVIFRLAQLQQLDIVGQFSRDLVDSFDAGLELGAFSHQTLRFGGVIPEFWVFGERV